MKIAYIILAFFLVGCNASQPTKKSVEIQLDRSILSDENSTSGWLAYGLALQSWEPEYLENGSPDLFKREIYARETASTIWKELKQNGSAQPDPDLDILEVISDAGYMAEYLWVYLKNSNWYETDDLELDLFQEWANENLKDHKPILDTGVSVR